MYDIVDYAGMLAFKRRTSAYGQALEANIAPGAVVLDIGTGTGILSFLACRAGAARVYAVEPEDVIQLARETAADNGFSGRIEFLQALTTEIDLPEKIDGIVGDVHGVLPLYGKSVLSILDARDRFLKPNGWIIPRAETIWGALCNCPALYADIADAWNTEYKFDLKRARMQAVNNVRGVRLRPEDLIVEPKPWAVLDYEHLDNIGVSGELSWLIRESVTAHGVCMWYDCETSVGFGFSNSPMSQDRYDYRHAFFPWPEGLELISGDQVRVEVRGNYIRSDYMWSWDTYVSDTRKQEKARYRQSSFCGTPLSLERIRKRGASFVPSPKEDARIDCRVLKLMQSDLSLGEIARALVAEFPHLFRDWNTALSKAADLSEKYSK